MTTTLQAAQAARADALARHRGCAQVESVERAGPPSARGLQVAAVADRGVRLPLVAGLSGLAAHWDLFAPWDQITSMLVATPEHDVQTFGAAAGKWQTQMDAAGSPATASPAAPVE